MTFLTHPSMLTVEWIFKKIFHWLNISIYFQNKKGNVAKRLCKYITGKLDIGKKDENLESEKCESVDMDISAVSEDNLENKTDMDIIICSDLTSECLKNNTTDSSVSNNESNNCVTVDGGNDECPNNSKHDELFCDSIQNSVKLNQTFGERKFQWYMLFKVINHDENLLNGM